MAETIATINEIHDWSTDDQWLKFDGYEVVTDQQRILMLIDNGQSCCEDFGYLITEDDPSKFVGSEFLGVDRIDLSMEEKNVQLRAALTEDDLYSLCDGDAMFVNVKTDRGTLQFVAYNSHNGYYGHIVRIISRDLNYEDYV